MCLTVGGGWRTPTHSHRKALGWIQTQDPPAGTPFVYFLGFLSLSCKRLIIMTWRAGGMDMQVCECNNESTRWHRSIYTMGVSTKNLWQVWIIVTLTPRLKSVVKVSENLVTINWEQCDAGVWYHTCLHKEADAAGVFTLAAWIQHISGLACVICSFTAILGFQD